MRPEHLGLHHLGEAENALSGCAARGSSGPGTATWRCWSFARRRAVVGNQFRLFEFPDQRVLLAARHQGREARRIEPMRQQVK